MLRTLHPVLRYAILATPVCVLAFLLMSSFFTGWDGRAVSRRPARSSDATVTAVLIVTDDGRATEVPWPRELAEGLGLPERAALVAPNEIPETAPHTTKLPFTLSFVVLPPGGVVMSRPTTTPAAVIVPFVLAGLGLLLFNVTQSGVPWSWRPEEAPQPPPPEEPPRDGAPAEGAPAARPAARRSGYGPPPSRRSRRR